MSIRRVVLGVVVVLAVGVSQVLHYSVAAQSQTVVWPADAIKWADNPGVPGAKVAVLWGDPAKGPYGALKQVPGGAGPGFVRPDSRRRRAHGDVPRHDRLSISGADAERLRLDAGEEVGAAATSPAR